LKKANNFFEFIVIFNFSIVIVLKKNGLLRITSRFANIIYINLFSIGVILNLANDEKPLPPFVGFKINFIHIWLLIKLFDSLTFAKLHKK